MPLPERYAQQVPDVIAIWEPEGYFKAQAKIWEAECEARHELYGQPTKDQLTEIRQALVLTPQDIQDLTQAKGHETNTFLRRVQSRLSAEAGNFVHQGNTSSDVLDTSLSMQIQESLGIVHNDFVALKDSLTRLATVHKDTLQIARSHGQDALPHVFGHQVLSWLEEVKRDIERIERSQQVIAVGKLSGEVGTNVFIEPELEELALKKLDLVPDSAPTQVISRDRHAEVVGHMAIGGATLARIATDIRLLSITEIGEVREPFDQKAQQGSSAMPHKRNPELSERIVGLNRRIRSGMDEELDSMILWWERDISHSSTERYVFPDVFGNVVYATRLMRQIVDGLVVNKERMLENINATYGAIYSSRLLNALIDTGKFTRTQAYELVKGLAQQAMDIKTNLQKLAADNPEITEVIDAKTLEGLFDPKFYLKNIDVAYRRAGLEV